MASQPDRLNGKRLSFGRHAIARPRKQDAIDIRARAIEETIAALRTNGAAPSLAALAARIGCSAPALYAHFDNKDDLLDQVRIRAQADLRAEKRQRYAEPASDPIGALQAGGRGYVDFARHNPALYRLIFAPAHAVNRNSVMMDEDAVSPLANGVRTAQKAGYFSSVDADDMARLMWFALHGAILMALDHQNGSEDGAWQQAYGVIDTIGAFAEGRA